MRSNDVFVMTVAFSWLGALSLPGAEPCNCPPPECPTDVPAPVSTEAPPTPTAQAGNLLFSESLYGSFGGEYPLLPRQQTRSISPTFGQTPNVNTTLNVGPYPAIGTPDRTVGPNQYAPFNVQAIYQDDMWAPGRQEEDFAKRTIFMLGADISAANHILSGAGKTRSTQPGDTNEDKYTMGALIRGVALRGMTIDDLNNIFGVNAAAYASFDNNFEKEPGSGLIRAYVNELKGAEFNSLIGRFVSAENETMKLQGPVDTRQEHYKEDDLWNLTPAMVNTMMGVETNVWLDGKMSDQLTDPNGKPGGFIGGAYAMRANVIAVMPHSYVNTGFARGLQVNYSISQFNPNPESGFNRTPGYYCEGERCASPGVGDYVGIEVTPPGDDCCRTQKVTGLVVFDQSTPDHCDSGTETNAGGAPLLSSRGLAEELNGLSPHEPENGASIVTRGRIVVGDSEHHDGFNTDVLHLRDVLQLRGRTSPPKFDSSVHPSDRAGLLYYDLTRNRLCVSLAAGEEDIVWADLAIDPDSLRAAPLSDEEEKAAKVTPDELREAVESAKSAAKAGDSNFIAPRIRPAGGQSIALNTQQRALPFLLEGFNGGVPRVYWRRVPKPASDAGNPTPWREVADGGVSAAAGLPGGAISVSADFLAESKTLPPAEGQRLEILAVDPETGHTAGAALRITVN